MDIGRVMFLSFISIIQSNIYMLFGVTSFFHKKLTPKGAALMGGILNYFYIPAFTILELARLSTFENIPKMTILILNFTVAILLRFTVAWVLAKITKHDAKTLEPFVIMHSIPDFGSLTLGFTISMCKNIDSPLYSDPQCDNQLGYVTLNTIVLFPLMYSIGVILHNRGYRRYSILKYKLSYIWYFYLSKVNRKDKIAKYLIFKYLSTWNVRAEVVYKKFVKQFQINVESNGLYQLYSLNKGKVYIPENYFSDPQSTKKRSECNYLTSSENERLNLEALTCQASLYFAASNFEVLRKYLKLLKDLIDCEIKVLPEKSKEFKIDLKSKLDIEFDQFYLCLDNYKIPIDGAYDILFFCEDDEKIINDLFEEFRTRYQIRIENLTDTPNVSTNQILKKLFNPSIICVFLGIIIGLSGMKKFLISKVHYLTNMTDVVFITSLNLPAFVLIPCGLLATRVPTILKMLKLPISQQLISFIMTYLLFPAIGIAIVSLWRVCFPHVMEESIVLRFNLYIPFCVPLGGYYIELIEETNNYYGEEFCYCFGKQYTVSILSITIFLTLFFLTIS